MKKFIGLSLVSLFLCGCFTPTKDPSRFYTMRSPIESSDVSADLVRQNPIIVALQIDKIPEYANCPYIVTLKHNNEISRSSIHRWAEPLQNNLKTIYSEGLQEQLGKGFMVIPVPFSQKRGISPDYKITLTLSDFIFSENKKQILLTANWFLYNFKTDKVEELGTLSLQQYVRNHTYPDIVNGMRNITLKMISQISEKLLVEKPIFISQVSPDTKSDDLSCSLYKKSNEIGNSTSINFAKLVHLKAKRGVYVVMSNKKGDRLFSGYLKSGEEKIIPCDEEYEVHSSDDNKLLITENK